MKASKLIENLKYLEETYGDLDVKIIFEEEGGGLKVIESVHFAYVQFPDKNDEFVIKNSPFRL